MPKNCQPRWSCLHGGPTAGFECAHLPTPMRPPRQWPVLHSEKSSKNARGGVKKYPYFETCFYHGIVSSWSLYSTSIKSLEDGMLKAILASCQLRPELHPAVVNIPDLRWASLGKAFPKWAHDRSLMSPTQLDRPGRLKHILFHVGCMNACRRCWELCLWQKAAATITVYYLWMLHDVIPPVPLNLCP